MAKELTENQGKWIWKRRGAYKILELAKEGKSVPEIAKEVKWKQETVWNFISSLSFLRRLEAHLQSVFFNFQKNRILALEEISKYLWDITMERKQVDGLSPAQAANHLVKILNLKDKEPKIINPQKYDIIMNISKTEPEKFQDLAKEFGFSELLPEGKEPEPSPE